MSGYDVCKHGRIRCAECAYVEELEDRIEELEQQNKRYREALEEIKELTRFDDGSKEKEYEIACKALEESEGVFL